jgi:hypothetical protein
LEQKELFTTSHGDEGIGMEGRDRGTVMGIDMGVRDSAVLRNKCICPGGVLWFIFRQVKFI